MRRSAASSGIGLLTSVTDLPEPQLREALDRLTNAGLLFVRGTPPESSYMFKHALVQDAAYGTLLRSRRQRLHSVLPRPSKNALPRSCRHNPRCWRSIARKLGWLKRRSTYWLKAGQQALARSAMAEAVAQLRKGLDVLAGLPNGPLRQRQELDLQTALGPALTATKGWSAPEVGETIARALVVAEQLDSIEDVVPLVVTQQSFHLVRAEHKLALALGERLEQIGRSRRDAAVQSLGRYFQGDLPVLLASSLSPAPFWSGYETLTQAIASHRWDCLSILMLPTGVPGRDPRVPGYA